MYKKQGGWVAEDRRQKTEDRRQRTACRVGGVYATNQIRLIAHGYTTPRLLKCKICEKQGGWVYAFCNQACFLFLPSRYCSVVALSLI